MTAEQLKALRALRSEGYAVIVWTPEELGSVSPEDMEDWSIGYGNDALDMYNRPETEGATQP